jgi:hypothetical protein
MSRQQFFHLLHDKINTVSFDKVKEDVVRFIQDEKSLEIWSKNYFMDLTEKLKLENI